VLCAHECLFSFARHCCPQDLPWDLMRRDIKEHGKGVFVMMNHVSFLDAMVFSAYCPTDIIIHTRTLMKAGLFKLPIFGVIAKRCGHFPVFFSGTKLGDFSTNKDRMNQVMEGVNKHVLAGGSLALFPEGQIGKNPGTQCSAVQCSAVQCSVV
jgi:1-acyl-sn-glycerol-3-phosphate acyltransferase